MSWLYVSEYNQFGFDAQKNTIPAPKVPPLVDQPGLAIGGTSIPSSPTSGLTNFIEVATDTACCLAFGTVSNPPTAVSGFHRLGPNEVRFYVCNPGTVVAVIASAVG